MGLFKSNKQLRCTTDKETGNVHCDRFVKNKDGTEEILASVDVTTDGNCNVIMENASEAQDGELQELEKIVQARVVGKCVKNRPTNKPQDY